MYLKSIRITNYRAHKNTSIEFDRHLTLIGGPNESGKSTLVEAAHRALFLKSRTSGEYQRSMISLYTAESPEVELQFCKDNRDYTILKRFAGARGTTLLTSSNGLNLRNEEAEEKLAELLGLQVARYSPENWSHLWVWQGTSTDNLLNQDASYRTDLLQKLQHLGAAGLIQSDLDHRLKAKVLDAFESIFNKNQSFKASSEAFKADKNRESCQEQWENKRLRFQELKQAADQYDEADRQFRDVVNQINKQQQALEKARADLKTVNAIKQNLAETERLLREHQQKLIDIETAQKNYDQLQQEKKNAAQRLAERRTAHDIALQSQKDLQKTVVAASSEEDTLNKLLRATRLQLSIAQAATQLNDQHKELVRSEKLQQQVISCESERIKIQRLQASIPNITPKKLEDLAQIEKEIFEAEASLKAMAASIRILQSESPVTLNGQPITENSDYPISKTTELAIGKTTRLLITPGDGTSLHDAQHKLTLLRQRQLEKLDQWKIASYKEAQKFAIEKNELTQKLKAIEEKLSELDTTQIANQLGETQLRLERLNHERDRDTETLAAFLTKENLILPELQPQETWQDRYEILEQQQRELAIQINQQRSNLEACRDHVYNLDVEIKECEHNIKSTEEKLEHEARKLGDPEERESLVVQLKQFIATQKEEVQKFRNTLDELQAEHLERLITRHERSLTQLHQDKEAAIAARAAANAKLRSDGSVDIYAELAAAESALHYAQNQFEMHQREALGIKLLKELFDAEQQKLSDALTQPFVQRMKKYVQCFTGEIARISFEVTNKGFDQLQIARPSDNNAPVDFEHLSGGAKEQIAAAARLAIAEVLSSDSSDGLPVVFDDAFSYTDSRRIEALPIMIEHAVDAGLQVIILTCNPLQYSALGAATVRLSRP